MNEKELAIQFATKLNENKHTFYAHGIPHFTEKFPNINLELLQQELAIFGLKIEQGNNIKCKSKFYLNEWNKFQTFFIFYEENESNL